MVVVMKMVLMLNVCWLGLLWNPFDVAPLTPGDEFIDGVGDGGVGADYLLV